MFTPFAYRATKAAAAPPGPAFITAGLVRWYNAGDTSSYPGSGTTWTDLQASGNNLTINNSPTFVSSGDGSYFTMDGSDDFMNGSDSGLPNGSSDRSWFFWYYRESATDFVGTGGYATSNFNQGFNSYQTAGYSPNNRGWLMDKYGGAAVGAGDVNFPEDEWSYIGVTYDNSSSTLSYYRNGQLEASGNLGTVNTVLSGVLEIARTPGVPGVFAGRLAQVHIYNVALSDAEVEQNFDAQKTFYGL